MKNFYSVDTFPTYRQLVETGFKPKQAEVLIETFRHLNNEFAANLVTKELFEERMADLVKQINALSHRMDSFEQKLEILKKDLIIKLGGIIFASMAFFSVAVPYIQKIL
ncbi:MAG: hypothetical protein ACK5BE_05910 [Alphaproteobacteria bacterium]|jgi:hypothetical protein